MARSKSKPLSKGKSFPQPATASNFVSIAQALAVADCGSFSRAARILGAQQSTVSRRIFSLEEELGVALFERHRNGVSLTNAGRSFLERMRPAFQEIETATKRAISAGQGAEGVVRVGLAAPISPLLVRLIGAFREERDGVLLAWHEGSRRSHLAKIVDRSLDVGIIAQIQGAGEFDMAPLWSSPIYVAIPDAHDLALGTQIDWAYLREETFLFGLNEDAAELRDIVLNRFGEFDHPPRFENYAVNQRSVLQFVAMGCGVTLIGEPSALMRQQGVTFRPLADKSATLTYAAVWLPENDNPALRRFLSLARKMAKKG